MTSEKFVSGYLTDEASKIISGILNEENSLENIIDYCQKYGGDSDDAWYISNLIGIYLRHTFYNKNHPRHLKFEKYFRDNLYKNKKNIEVQLKLYADEYRSGRDCSDYSWNFDWNIWGNFFGEIPEISEAPNPPLNCTFEDTKRYIEHNKKCWHDIANLVDPNSLYSTNIDEALAITGILSINIPWTWGKKRETIGHISRALIGLNKLLGMKTGLSGPILGLNQRINLSIGIQTENFGGRIRRHHPYSHRQVFDMELADNLLPENLQSTLYHEWCHGLDFLLYYEAGVLGNDVFLSMMTNAHHLDNGMEIPHEKTSNIIQLLIPYGPSDHSLVACIDLLNSMDDIRKGRTQFFFDELGLLKEAIDKLKNFQEKEYSLNVMGRIMHILENIYTRQSNPICKFKIYSYWSLIQTALLEARIRERGRPTQRHPFTILVWLSKKNTYYTQAIHSFKYFESSELLARSFEMFMKNDTRKNFFPLRSPSFPGNDFHLVNEKWLELFSSLKIWWSKLKPYDKG